MNKIFVSKRVDRNCDFETMLKILQEASSELNDFYIYLSFVGGGMDDVYWCDWYGICFKGWRYKTFKELLVERNIKRIEEVKRQAAAEADERRFRGGRIVDLQEETARLAEQVALAEAKLAQHQKEHNND
ncbi:MAG: hypothetical protein U0516_04320 [Candidatus Saccharibacteria bacterium]